MIYTTDIIGDQWSIFIKAINLGLVLGICYDFLRIVRTIIRFGKRLFIISDFFYCIWASFLIFSFLLNENFGIPRFYIYLGAASGFLLWYFSFGRITVPAAKIFRKVLKTFLKPFGIIFRKILKSAEKRTGKLKILFQKAEEKEKSLLKKKSGLVYNILCLNISKAFSLCGGKAGKEPEKVESIGTEKTEEGIFSQSSSCCLRGISSVFPDIDASRYQRKTK